MSRVRLHADLPIPRNLFVNPDLDRLSTEPTGLKSGASLALSSVETTTAINDGRTTYQAA